MTTEPVRTIDPETTLEALKQRLRATPRAARPHEHAALKYAVGLAYAELPTGDRNLNLSRAVGSYREAAALFNPQRFPVEHARVSGAMGAALRELGQAAEAAQVCERAIALLEGTEAAADRGAALNNLGLARSDLGQHEGAVEALTAAAEVFQLAGEVRHQVMALHNLGQAHMTAGEYGQALRTLQQGLDAADPEQVPYQWALLHHAAGAACTAVGQPQQAVEHFTRALEVFTRDGFPFQHALAKNNLGLAWAQIGDVEALRRALAAYEDAVRVLDPRLHRAQWEQAYRNLELAETALTDLGVQASRVEHFAALVAGADPRHRQGLMRNRLVEVVGLPERTQFDVLAELQAAFLSLPDEDERRTVLAVWMDVLMELPDAVLGAGLRAWMAVVASIPDEDSRVAADELLDWTIQAQVMGPQRLRVRDTLDALGWVRP
jgi:tetratricopeptide (TPR) repeat protein